MAGFKGNFAASSDSTAASNPPPILLIHGPGNKQQTGTFFCSLQVSNLPPTGMQHDVSQRNDPATTAAAAAAPLTARLMAHLTGGESNSDARKNRKGGGIPSMVGDSALVGGGAGVQGAAVHLHMRQKMVILRLDDRCRKWL